MIPEDWMNDEIKRYISSGNIAKRDECILIKEVFPATEINEEHYSKEQVDYMLNEVLVGILCTKYYEVDRNSNGIAQFVIEYLDKQKPK